MTRLILLFLAGYIGLQLGLWIGSANADEHGDVVTVPSVSTPWKCGKGSHPIDPNSIESIAMGDFFGCIPDETVTSDKPTCGEGPHQITVREERFVACDGPPLARYGDGSGEYYRTDDVTLTVYCGRETYTVQETWSDWPECEGAKLVSKP